MYCRLPIPTRQEKKVKFSLSIVQWLISNDRDIELIKLVLWILRMQLYSSIKTEKTFMAYMGLDA